MSRGWRFALAVGVTSLVLVAVLAAAGLVAARSALASAPWMGVASMGARFGPGGPGFELPPELEGLRDVPADQRFDHFLGVQVNLTDRDGNPITLDVTPGTVSDVGEGTLGVAGNDGAGRSYTVDENTVVRGRSASPDDAQQAQAGLASGDKVVVVTLNESTTALAVINGGTDGFTPGAWGGPGGHWGSWHR